MHTPTQQLHHAQTYTPPITTMQHTMSQIVGPSLIVSFWRPEWPSDIISLIDRIGSVHERFFDLEIV